jgi:ABC-type proline/glycine betaine transport system substrate-binding protein
MTRRIAIVCGVVLACSFAAGASAAPEPAKSQPVVGTWQGSLPNGMGGQIRVVLHVVQEAERLKATMDSPDQGNQTGIPVEKVAFEKEKFTLDVAVVRGSYEGTLDAAKGEISGTWRQNGQEIPLVFKKGEAAK